MKWYWAILQTIAVIALLLFFGPTEPADAAMFGCFFFALFGIWVAADSSSFGWGLFVYFLWPIGYPWYLIQRNSSERLVVRLEAGESVVDWINRGPGVDQIRREAGESVVDWINRGPGVDQMFRQAIRLDRKGDWEDAVYIYEQIAMQGGQDGEYARNCAQEVRAKMK